MIKTNLAISKFAILSFVISVILLAPSWNASSQETAAAWPQNIPGQNQGAYVRRQDPEWMTFDELKKLSENPYVVGQLREKLNKFWKTPIISNEAYYTGTKPRNLVDSKLGPFLRVASWNIEKSFQMKDAIEVWSAPSEKFAAMLDPDKSLSDEDLRQTCLRQRERLMTADVLILQEMDVGLKRSGYINAAEELAKTLQMNYAYGTEQLEIDPVILGLEKIDNDDGTVDQEATDYYAVDPARHKGAFGCAVLSRYPIKKVEVFQLQNQAYDWYASEKEKIGFLETTRRAGTKVAFKNELTREMKIGGRIFMRVDLEVPGLPQNTLSIINIHLEIKCQPEGREIQMAEILGHIRNIRNNVIVMGDFNSSSTDLSPTSVTRVVTRSVKNPTNWLSLAVNYISPYGLAVNTTRGISNTTKNFQDPTARNIPVIAPNSVRGLFEMIKDFRFIDGGAFDFRGDKKRTINGKKGTLANSNERGRKGFVTTFRVKRPIGVIGKYRLDWAFVKSNLKDPEDKEGSYRFAPHFGETLEELNTSLKEPVSDHHPNVIDLPFEEPHI
ncbi:MAG: endonuclease/exonuclease/phosphatase family protein [Candidatus Omnitrophica bacterium]|nr:endonuclease/exonuclease/phosphatase family protein [Candidatus Omnitrophota bacterium]MDD5671853.1 endonuclease/exonuclease/phosphatase family protein [Candidatus Omnitrophota bacterium]